MDEVWMLDYLSVVFPRWGVFESEGAAWDWVVENDPFGILLYTPFKLTVNSELKTDVPHTAPSERYRNPK